MISKLLLNCNSFHEQANTKPDKKTHQKHWTETMVQSQEISSDVEYRQQQNTDWFSCHCTVKADNSVFLFKDATIFFNSQHL